MSVTQLTGHFDPEKLSFMRRLNNESLAEVSAGVEYSTTYISKWEKGVRIPDFKAVQSLAKHFHVDHQFFLVDYQVPEITGPVFFRKAAVLPKKKVIQAESSATSFAYAEEAVGQLLHLPEYEQKLYENKSSKFEPLSFDFIESIAKQLREDYNLGEGPISNVTLLAERVGIRIKFADLQSEKVDAVTGWIDDRPYVVLNSRRTSSARIRHNLAHEIGHVLLHSHYSQSDVNSTENHKVIESEANHFAGALLMPARGIATDMARTNMNYLIQLKQHWKVSIQSLIYRGNQLGLISDMQALFLRQTIYRNGWRTEEPLDNSIAIELPSFLESAISFATDNPQATLQNASRNTGLSVDQFSDWLGISELVKDHKPGATLRIVK